MLKTFKQVKTNINKALNEEVKDLIQASTAYGLPNVLRSKRIFNKLFWLFYLILSATGAAYYIYNDLVDLSLQQR